MVSSTPQPAVNFDITPWQWGSHLGGFSVFLLVLYRDNIVTLPNQYNTHYHRHVELVTSQRPGLETSLKYFRRVFETTDVIWSQSPTPVSNAFSILYFKFDSQFHL